MPQIWVSRSYSASYDDILDLTQVADFSSLTPYPWLFYAKSVATRFPVSRVNFHQDESWRLKSNQVQMQSEAKDTVESQLKI